MNCAVELPDYKNKAYANGDYSGFKYHTRLGVKPARICFLSGTARSKEGATKFEAEFKKIIDPKIGPGHYTPLPPSARIKIVKRSLTFTKKFPVKRDGSESSSSSSSDSDTKDAKRLSQSEKAKLVRKSGLLWSRRSEGKILKSPGPADTPISRYPESIKIRENKIGFNSYTSPPKCPVSITAIAPKSSADVYKHTDIFKSSLGGKKEFNVPPIICVRAMKDTCMKCKKEIDENFFYIAAKAFICRGCHKEIMEGTSTFEKAKLSVFKQGKYCTRYHIHHKVKGFKKIIPYDKLYQILLRETYHNQYTGGRFIDEGIPTKEQRKTSGERSKIYQSLLSDSTFNINDLLPEIKGDSGKPMIFERTLGSHRLFEAADGMKRECKSCITGPVFFLSNMEPYRAIHTLT